MNNKQASFVIKISLEMKKKYCSLVRSNVYQKAYQLKIRKYIPTSQLQLAIEAEHIRKEIDTVLK